MHDIEPFFRWRDKYDSSEDKNSPFYKKEYSEFHFTNKIYNYHIHPQWDDFGSSTLYGKILFADYDTNFAIIELIGEWNDCLYNDIMYFRRNILEILEKHGITKYLIICENVLNFHGSDDAYYEDWYSEIADEGGWIVFLNTLDHVEQEMVSMQIHFYVNIGNNFNEYIWRNKTPKNILLQIEHIINNQRKLIQN